MGTETAFMSTSSKPKLKKHKQPPKPKQPVEVREFPKLKGKKPKVLMLTDVKGWGAWRRGEYIIKHLSDEFEFDLIDLKTFSETEKIEKYDMFFPLLHILMRYTKCQEMAETHRTITTITSRQILKESYGQSENQRIKSFKQHMEKVDLVIINNLLVRFDTQRLFTGPVRYAPRGVDPDIFKFIRYPMTSRFTVCYVGKPVEEKGLDGFIRPACNRTQCRILVNKRNFTNAMPESHMVEKYNDCNVYIVASIIDGTPNPALEAASCGRPIISNEIGNMPEFIKDGENGFLVPLEIDSYVKSLWVLKNNRKLAYYMGQKARETVLNGWTWDILLNKNQRNILREVMMREKKK